MELKKKKFNRPFIMSLQLAVILGGLGIWLLMFFNNGRVTVSLEIIKYLPYLFILLAILLAIFAKNSKMLVEILIIMKKD